VGIIYRPDHAESELSDPRSVPDVEGGFREEATGNGAWILEAAHSGELEGEVRATPSEDYDRVSRGEQNTLQRSNIEVGEGNPIVDVQEVMLPIQTGRLEGETEIPIQMKTESESDVSLRERSVYERLEFEVDVSLREMSVYERSELEGDVSLRESPQGDTNSQESPGGEVKSQGESRSQTRAETVSALLDQSSNAQSPVETQSDTVSESDGTCGDRKMDMTIHEEIPVYEGGMLSGSQTQAETISALPDKVLVFGETAQSLTETQSGTAPDLSETSCQEHCYQEVVQPTMLPKSQQGGPRPECTQEDQRSCQFDFPVKATGASLGKTMPLRTLSMSKCSNVTEIWEEAERRLGTKRNNFSLVYSGSRYLPPSGTLENSEQLLEIRWQGRGGNLYFKFRFTINGVTRVEEIPKNLKIWEFLCGEYLTETQGRAVYVGNFQLTGELEERWAEEVIYEYFPDGDGWIGVWTDGREMPEDFDPYQTDEEEEGNHNEENYQDEDYQEDDYQDEDYQDCQDEESYNRAWDAKMQDPNKTPIYFESGDQAFWDSVEDGFPLGPWVKCVIGKLDPEWRIFGTIGKSEPMMNKH
jgi:hypothetical protein